MKPATTRRAEAALWFSRGVGLAIAGLLVYVIGVGAILASSQLLLVFLALLLASALEPVIGRLRGAVPIRRGPAILFTYVAFFGLVAGIGLVIVPGAIGELGQLAAALPAALEHARTWSQQLRLPALVSGLGALIDAAQAALRPGPPPAPGAVVAAGLSIANVVVSVLTVLTLIYFWLIERSHLQRFALSFVPAERRSETRDAWNEVETRLGGWIRGQLLLMAIVGVAAAVAYTLLGLPLPLALGLVAGIAEAIPLVGPALGAVPAILVAATLKPDALVPVIIAYLVIQFIEINVLVPRIMRNAIGVSPFLILVSLLIGGAVGGVVGALVAVPAVAALVAVLERLQDREAPVTQDAAAPGGAFKPEGTDEPAHPTGG